MELTRKWKCNDCGEISIESDLLVAPNPFDTNQGITGCPKCKSCYGFTEICDDPNCTLPASCGFPSPEGYRRTCFKHYKSSWLTFWLMNKTDFQTPPAVCDYMASLVIHGVKSVLEPTPGSGNLVKALRKNGLSVTAPKRFSELALSATFDAVAMNPPFTPMTLGYYYLYKSMHIAQIQIIALMPWLTVINSTKRIHDIREWGIASIAHLPRSVFKGSRVQTCILDMHKGYTGDISFLIYDDPLGEPSK